MPGTPPIDQGTFTFSLTGTANLVYSVDTSKIAGAVAGKSRSAAYSILKGFSGGIARHPDRTAVLEEFVPGRPLEHHRRDDQPDSIGALPVDALRACLLQYSLLHMEEIKQDAPVGTVEEVLPNSLFRVRMPSDELVLSYLAGKMRLHRIRVLVEDKVELVLDPYGGRARIVRRLS